MAMSWKVPLLNTVAFIHVCAALMRVFGFMSISRPLDEAHRLAQFLPRNTQEMLQPIFTFDPSQEHWDALADLIAVSLLILGVSLPNPKFMLPWLVSEALIQIPTAFLTLIILLTIYFLSLRYPFLNIYYFNTVYWIQTAIWAFCWGAMLTFYWDIEEATTASHSSR